MYMLFPLFAGSGSRKKFRIHNAAFNSVSATRIVCSENCVLLASCADDVMLGTKNPESLT